MVRKEKEKLLDTSNFSFSHNVFHNYMSLVCQNAVLCGNELTLLPNDKILDWFKLKAFADDKINLTKK